MSKSSRARTSHSLQEFQAKVGGKWGWTIKPNGEDIIDMALHGEISEFNGSSTGWVLMDRKVFVW